MTLEEVRVLFLRTLEERDPLCPACDDFGWVYSKKEVGLTMCLRCNWPRPPKKKTRYDRILDNMKNES